MAGRSRIFDLGTPLFETTFCVLDLETTGGSPAHDDITEVGAIKFRGGQVIGSLDTFVDSSRRIENLIPNLWEFMLGSVLVAHNSRFDASFLLAASKDPATRFLTSKRSAHCGLPGGFLGMRCRT